MIDFDKIVHKLWERRGSILLIEDIAEIIDPTGARSGSDAQVAKCVYRLVHSEILVRIRNGVFLVWYDPLLERAPQFFAQRYWEIVEAFLRVHGGVGNALIAGVKSMELHCTNFTPPKILMVYVPLGYLKSDKKIITLSPQYSIVLRSIQTGGKFRSVQKNTDFHLYLKSLSQYQTFPGIKSLKLRVLSPESSVLDALSNGMKGEIQASIGPFISLWGGSLNRVILWDLVARRYITGINRLRELAQKMDNQKLYQQCLSVIRDEWGGCFVTSRQN